MYAFVVPSAITAAITAVSSRCPGAEQRCQQRSHCDAVRRVIPVGTCGDDREADADVEEGNDADR